MEIFIIDVPIDFSLENRFLHDLPHLLVILIHIFDFSSETWLPGGGAPDAGDNNYWSLASPPRPRAGIQ